MAFRSCTTILTSEVGWLAFCDLVFSPWRRSDLDFKSLFSAFPELDLSYSSQSWWRFVPVELTTFSRRWLTHTVYETKGVSPCVGWLRFIGLALGL